MYKKMGDATLKFNNPPIITSFSSVVGKKESDGPLGSCFDYVSEDNTFGENTWEKSESRMQMDAVNRALSKVDVSTGQVDLIFAGDLLNQCVGSNFGLRELGIPFLGLYGACSTMAESLILSALSIDGEFASTCVAVTSSHFCSAERQFRFPLEYGGQRPPSAQWTVTGSGAMLVQDRGIGVKIKYASIGKITDLGIKDVNNMGSAMAPAAASTLSTFFKDTNTRPEQYDMIITGDLSEYGVKLTKKLLAYDGYELSENFTDCGLLIYNSSQDVHAGGSGCGCSAVVLAGYILPKIMSGALSNILFVGTGALMSPTSVLQGESIPSVAHLVNLVM
jgi:stage V sporulation protein AD